MQWCCFKIVHRRQNLASKDDEVHRLESLIRELRSGGGGPTVSSSFDDTKILVAERARVDAEQQVAVMAERVRALENQLQDNSHRYEIHDWILRFDTNVLFSFWGFIRQSSCWHLCRFAQEVSSLELALAKKDAEIADLQYFKNGK